MSWSSLVGGLAVVAVVATSGAEAAPAVATTVSPASSGIRLTSTNWSMAISGGGTASCSDARVSSTTPTGTATTLSNGVFTGFSNCTAFFFPATIAPDAACTPPGASAISMSFMYNGSAAPQASVSMFQPSACQIKLNVPAISCTVTIPGNQTWGNATSGAGGMAWSNGNASTFSSISLNNAVVPSVTSSGGGLGCPTPGAHSGSVSGTYVVTAPSTAPGVTVGP